MDAAALGLPILVALIAVALLFDFLNGLHDAANSIATVVATRVLRPQTAVIWAAFFNFIAFAVFGLHVAQTVGTGIVSAGVVDGSVIFGALSGAIVWNIVTWNLGIPSSSSHALIGGLDRGRHRQGRVRAPSSTADWRSRRSASSCLRCWASSSRSYWSSSCIGPAGTRRPLPSTADSACCNSFRRRCIRSVMAATTRRRRWASLPCCSFRKALLGDEFHVPFWVVISCQAAMGLGTLLGGWRIVHTMGSRITHLKPIQGFCAETGGALTLFLATALGVPVSTTHTITGAIVGVGAARRAAAVRWHVAQRIVIAWVLTLPAAAVLGGLAFKAAGYF